MRKLCLLLGMLLLFNFVPVFALEDESDRSGLSYSRTEILSVFETVNINVPEDAIVGVTEFKINEAAMVLVPSVVHQDGNRVQQNVLISIDKNNDPIDLSRLTRAISYVSSGNISNVYISAYYYRSTASYDSSLYIYRPYKVAFASSVTKNVYVNYHTSGVRFNLSGVNQTTTGNHDISCSAYPATANQQYDTTSYYNGYIGPGSSECKLKHWVYMKLNGSIIGSFSCPGDGTYVGS